MNKQNILTFLREWLAYSNTCMRAHKAGEKAPHSQVFTAYDGLCGNLDKWAHAFCVQNSVAFDDRKQVFKGLGDELKSLFRADGLCTVWTFGERSFHMRFDKESNARCPNRRRWVKKTIANLEKELDDGNN